MFSLTIQSFSEKNFAVFHSKTLKPHQKFALVGVFIFETIPLALSLIAYFGIFGKLSPTANKAILGSVAGASVLLLLVEGCLLKCKNLDPEKKEELLLGVRVDPRFIPCREEVDLSQMKQNKKYYKLMHESFVPITVDEADSTLLLDERNKLYLYQIGESKGVTDSQVNPAPSFLEELDPTSYLLFYKYPSYSLIKHSSGSFYKVHVENKRMCLTLLKIY